MRIYEFEHESGIFAGVVIDSDNKVTVTIKNIVSQLGDFFESTVVGDNAGIQNSRVILMKLIHFLKRVIETEEIYKCGTAEKLTKSIKDDYPLLYGCLQNVAA